MAEINITVVANNNPHGSRASRNLIGAGVEEISSISTSRVLLIISRYSEASVAAGVIRNSAVLIREEINDMAKSNFLHS